MKKNFIFLHGISVRSGTNLSGLIFNRHPDVEVIPRNETTQEFPFLQNINSFKGAFLKFRD